MSDMEDISAQFAQLTADLHWPVAVVDYEQYSLNEQSGKDFLDNVERAAVGALRPGISLVEVTQRPQVRKRVNSGVGKIVNDPSNPISKGNSMIVQGFGVVLLAVDEEKYEPYPLEQNENLLGHVDYATVAEYPYISRASLQGCVDLASLQDEDGDLPLEEGSGLVLVVNDVTVSFRDELGTVIKRSAEGIIPFSLSGLALHEALRLL